MPISARSSLSVGLDALRANPLRTLLSTLGMVMGVGAMVSVLAMGDGVERFAREQIERTTDLLAIVVTPQVTRQLDGISVRRADVIEIDASTADDLARAVPRAASVAVIATGSALVSLPGDTLAHGFMVRAIGGPGARDPALRFQGGGWFADADTAVVVLGARAAGAIAGDTAHPEAALGRTLALAGNPHRVVGVLTRAERETMNVAYVPLADSKRAFTAPRPAQMVVTAARVEEVDSLRAGIEGWAQRRYGAAWKERLGIESNRARVEQVATGMRIFKLLMGAITFVSLLVGGIGIMNVLLAAVAERTREIGIRKATGARDRDILAQFLAESVTISSAGAALGVMLGLAIAFATAAVMRAQTGAPVTAAITLPTILVAAGAAVTIGLAFGLYPALRAARLSPIDAIRHE